MKKHRKVIIGSVILAIAIAALGYTAFMGNTTYYYDIGDYLGRSTETHNQNTRISGLVSPGSYKDGFTLYFTLEDLTGSGESIAVSYSGSVPDTFKEGQQVVVEGKMADDGQTFVASQLIIKCSSKYEPA